MGDHHVGAAVLGVHFLDQLAQQRGAHRVETGVGLVEQHDLGVEHERAGEPGTLAHPPRELVGHLLVGVAEADLAQAPVDDLRNLILALLGVLAQREGDVVVEVERAKQRPVLEQHTELLAQLEEVVVGERGDRLPGDDHVALVGVEQPDDVLDAHRLAGAGGAEDHRHLAFGDTEVQTAQHAVGAERLVHVDELDRVGDVAGTVGAGVVLEVLRLGLGLLRSCRGLDGHALSPRSGRGGWLPRRSGFPAFRSHERARYS